MSCFAFRLINEKVKRRLLLIWKWFGVHFTEKGWGICISQG